MTANLVRKVTKATDLEQLGEITSKVIGEPCWRANLSYGDELSLHIGARIPYSQKIMAGKEKGAWILGTRGTAWKLESKSETIVTSEYETEDMRQKIKGIEDTSIVGFETSYPGLAFTVTFSNGYKLILTPPETEDDSGLPYWEMFTPEGMVLKVGPDAIWSYSPSDLPMTGSGKNTGS